MIAICPNCENEFCITASRMRAGVKFCGQKCRHEHPFKTGKKVRGKCRLCGKYIERSTHGKDIKHTYCSVKCKNEFHRVKKQCAYCGKNIDVFNSEDRENNFCSKDCLSKYQVKNNSPAWKGGEYENRWGHKITHTEDYYIKNNRKVFIYKARHRLVAEKYIGRKLKRNTEIVVHLNGIMDCNEPWNLYVFGSRSEWSSAREGSIQYPQKSNLNELKNK